MKHSEEPSEDSNAEAIPLTESADLNLAAAETYEYLTQARNITRR